MLSSFRRLSKSKVGTAIAVIFLLTILASFALGDITNLRKGGGLSQGVLARIGSEQLTEPELSDVMQRQLQQLREQKPDATYADLAPEFDEIVNSLILERTLKAYAAKHGLMPAKTLIDAEIVKIPGVRGLDGKFSEVAYRGWLAQNRLTDAQVRSELTTMVLQRLVLTPLAANMRVPVGVARPYASMLLEQRSGDVALLPTSAFTGGAAPTDAELQQFYSQYRQRYVVPEQRVIRMARIGAEQAPNAVPSEQEITAYYNANQATYGGGETRVLSRASVSDRNAAAQIAQRAKSGSFAAAAAPAGFSATDVALGEQSREQLTSLAGPAVAAQVFSAPQGTVVGPVQSSTGWDVIKVESVKHSTGKTLAQARSEIIAKLSADKRKNALSDLVAKIEEQIEDGRNFSEVAAANRLPVTTTPPVLINGVSPRDPGFKLPADYAAVLKSAFDLSPDDDPVVETLPNDGGFVLIATGEITPAAPAPLASIRDKVAADFLTKRALDRAKAVANAIVAKANAGVPLAKAWAEAGAPAKSGPRPLQVRRLQLTQLQGQVPPPLRILFSLSAGKTQLVAAPGNQGFFVVKLNSITPGDALSQPGLISQVQKDFNEQAGAELVAQFLTAAQKEVGIKRDEAAIAAAKRRFTTGG
jgi:peptidyl-prolyl cis-trans isomerase D